MIITIDGPTASGKSRAARDIAQRFGIYYLSTGYLYRAVAYCALERGISIAEDTPLSPEVIAACADPKKLSYTYLNGEAHILYNQQDITGFLKSPIVDRAASIVSAQPAVRAALIEFQRHIARAHDVVADGRDCGSVVFPHAEYKFFMIADVAERARRWQRDQEARGFLCTLDEACAAIADRDTRDAVRTVSPLIVPEGAITLDTTHLSPDAVCEKIIAVVKNKK